MKYFFIIPGLSIKYNFHRRKPVDPPPVAFEVRQMLSYCFHIEKCMAIKYLSTVAVFLSVTMHATVSK